MIITVFWKAEAKSEHRKIVWRGVCQCPDCTTRFWWPWSPLQGSPHPAQGSGPHGSSPRPNACPSDPAAGPVCRSHSPALPGHGLHRVFPVHMPMSRSGLSSLLSPGRCTVIPGPDGDLQIDFPARSWLSVTITNQQPDLEQFSGLRSDQNSDQNTPRLQHLLW